MMDYSILKYLAKQQKVPLKKLAEKAGMTEAGFHQAIKNNSMRIDVLENLAKVLNVSFVDLIDENYSQVKEENNLLKIEIAKYKNNINELSYYNDLLKERDKGNQETINEILHIIKTYDSKEAMLNDIKKLSKIRYMIENGQIDI